MSQMNLEVLDAILEEQRKERAPDWDAGAYFNYFVFEHLLKSCDVSRDDLIASVVDGGDDCGIDSIICLIDNIPLSRYADLKNIRDEPELKIVILQSKHGTSYQERPLLDLASSVPQLLDPGRDDEAVATWTNAKLVERTREILDARHKLLPRFPEVSIVFYYAARTDHVHPKVEMRATDLVDKVSKSGRFANVDFHFLGVEDLLTYARQQERKTFSIRCATSPMSSPDGNGCVALVPLPEFRRFVAAEDGSLNTQLFESNVRDHEGRNEVNSAIADTLREREGNDFWWLNNGVTVVAQKVEGHGFNINLRSPQIVNGLQTSTEVFTTGVEDDDSRLILVKAIEAVDPGARDAIIQATNNQTSIPKSALRATDPVQRNLEDWLAPRNFFYDRRRNYHANRQRPIDRIVSIPTMARAVACAWLQEPHMARSRANQLVSHDEYYERIFDPTHPPQFYLTCLLLLRKSRRALKEHSQHAIHNVDDWENLLACAAAVFATRKHRPDVRDLATLDASRLPEHRLTDLIPLVAKHLRTSRTSTVPLRRQAESREVTTAMLEDARIVMGTSRWLSWPDEAVTDDFLRPAGRLDPGRR